MQSSVVSAASSPNKAWIDCLYAQLLKVPKTSIKFGGFYKACMPEQLALEQAIYEAAPEKLREDTVKAVVKDAKKLFEKNVKLSIGN
jgi:hypothetical protein